MDAHGPQVERAPSSDGLQSKLVFADGLLRTNCATRTR